ncbi:uncharacterized protein [Dermacentor albipictus]|uniref:uncharacterized protein isoform X1 n=1 Tax=Dermacentor albipictus TaxID=60249 RepID=UPI0038FD2AFE
MAQAHFTHVCNPKPCRSCSEPVLAVALHSPWFVGEGGASDVTGVVPGGYCRDGTGSLLLGDSARCWLQYAARFQVQLVVDSVDLAVAVMAVAATVEDSDQVLDPAWAPAWGRASYQERHTAAAAAEVARRMQPDQRTWSSPCKAVVDLAAAATEAASHLATAEEATVPHSDPDTASAAATVVALVEASVVADLEAMALALKLCSLREVEGEVMAKVLVLVEGLGASEEAMASAVE